MDSDAGHTNRVREHGFLLKMPHELPGINQADVLGAELGVYSRDGRFWEK